VGGADWRREGRLLDDRGVADDPDDGAAQTSVGRLMSATKTKPEPHVAIPVLSWHGRHRVGMFLFLLFGQAAAEDDLVESPAERLAAEIFHYRPRCDLHGIADLDLGARHGSPLLLAIFLDADIGVAAGIHRLGDGALENDGLACRSRCRRRLSGGASREGLRLAGDQGQSGEEDSELDSFRHRV
jgi:hypothetical protein